MRSLTALLAIIGIAGCATVAVREFDQRYGQPDPTRFDTPVQPVAGMSYRKDVQPILERRCVVCHGCYDSPCQLKLGAWEGIVRGSSQQPVYDAARLLEAPTTRLFVDAQLPSQWRQHGFSAVLNERTRCAIAVASLGGTIERMKSAAEIIRHRGEVEALCRGRRHPRAEHFVQLADKRAAGR